MNYTMEVKFGGKVVTFVGDSITLTSILVREFGEIALADHDECDSYYETVRGAIAVIF